MLSPADRPSAPIARGLASLSWAGGPGSALPFFKIGVEEVEQLIELSPSIDLWGNGVLVNLHRCFVVIVVFRRGGILQWLAVQVLTRHGHITVAVACRGHAIVTSWLPAPGNPPQLLATRSILRRPSCDKLEG